MESDRRLLNFILDTEQRKAAIEHPKYKLNKFYFRQKLRISEQMPLIMLIQSLRYDIRYYGAEMVDDDKEEPRIATKLLYFPSDPFRFI